MNVLDNFNIDGNKTKFFKNGFAWKEIPKFSVITGINGSGKTKLLEAINQYLNEKKKSNQFFYIPSTQTPNCLSKAFDRNEKEQEESRLIGTLKSWRDAWKREPNHKNQMKSSEFYDIVEWLEIEYAKPLINYSDTEINDLVKKIPLERFQENINNLKIEHSFIRFLEVQKEIKNEIFDLDLSLDERGKKVSEKLIGFFGTEITPWDMMNEKFEQYGFKHKIAAPTDRGKYHAKFVNDDGDEIEFNSLSSGEKVIAQLILWSYDGFDDRKIGNRNKLLIMDEFDAHLNPSMAQMFIEVVKDILIEQFKMQIIITTHSPSTIAYCNEEDLFCMESGVMERRGKQEIIELLTPGILTFKRDRLLLLTDKNFIIFTEGETDISHIKNAADKLGFKEVVEQCEFISAYGDKGKDYFNIFKKSDSAKKVMAIFDYDKKGIAAFNSVSKTNQEKISDNKNDITVKSYNEGSVYAVLLPLNYDEYKCESEYGYHPIEFLFNKDDLVSYKSESLVDEDSGSQSLTDRCYFKPPKGKKIRRLNLMQEEKGKFAEYIEEKKAEINFDRFKPLLEKVKELFGL